MIDALISGKLIKTPELRTGKSGKPYTQFLLSVPVGDEQPVIVSGIAFAETAERISKLQKGDPLSVIGGLKPAEWIDKSTGQIKHGLSITANNALSPYDIKKRKPKESPGKPTVSTGDNYKGAYEQSRPFDDPINF